MKHFYMPHFKCSSIRRYWRKLLKSNHGKNLSSQGLRSTRNNSWNTAGFKTGGHYTYWELASYRGCPIYRACTDAERNAEILRVHGESKHNNAWGPNRYYRKTDDRITDAFNDRQLRKWLKDPEGYDPVFIPKINSFSDDYW